MTVPHWLFYVMVFCTVWTIADLVEWLIWEYACYRAKHDRK